MGALDALRRWWRPSPEAIRAATRQFLDPLHRTPEAAIAVLRKGLAAAEITLLVAERQRLCEKALAAVRHPPLAGRRRVGELDVAIETPKGGARHWTDAATGEQGTTVLKDAYGYVRGTVGLDGEAVDCFLVTGASNAEVMARDAYLVLTAKPPDFTQPDEHKCILGARSEAEARALFGRAYDDPRFLVSIEALSWPAFVQWVRTSATPDSALRAGKALGRFQHLPLLPSKKNPRVRRRTRLQSKARRKAGRVRHGLPADPAAWQFYTNPEVSLEGEWPELVKPQLPGPHHDLGLRYRADLLGQSLLPNTYRADPGVHLADELAVLEVLADFPRDVLQARPALSRKQLPHAALNYHLRRDGVRNQAGDLLAGRHNQYNREIQQSAMHPPASEVSQFFGRFGMPVFRTELDPPVHKAVFQESARFAAHETGHAVYDWLGSVVAWHRTPPGVAQKIEGAFKAFERASDAEGPVSGYAQSYMAPKLDDGKPNPLFLMLDKWEDERTDGDRKWSETHYRPRWSNEQFAELCGFLIGKNDRDPTWDKAHTRTITAWKRLLNLAAHYGPLLRPLIEEDRQTWLITDREQNASPSSAATPTPVAARAMKSTRLVIGSSKATGRRSTAATTSSSSPGPTTLPVPETPPQIPLRVPRPGEVVGSPEWRAGYRDALQGRGPDLQTAPYLFGFQAGRRARREGFHGAAAEFTPSTGKALARVKPHIRAGKLVRGHVRTQRAYKLFRKRDGQLYPLFIDSRSPVPLNEWVPATHNPTKGYAPRPGWHAGILPLAPHLRTRAGVIAPDRVWAEVDLIAERDWQAEADRSPTRDLRERVPARGVYRFRTNKMQGGAWLIGGEMRVNRELSDPEVYQLLRDAGVGAEEARRELRGQPIGRAGKALLVLTALPSAAPCPSCRFEVTPGHDDCCPVCAKSIVRAHTRLVNGKPVQVTEYSDKRSRAWHPTGARRPAATPGQRPGIMRGETIPGKRQRPEPPLRAGATQFGQPVIPQERAADVKKKLALELGSEYTIDELQAFVASMKQPMEAFQQQIAAIVKRHGVAVTKVGKPREVGLLEAHENRPEYSTTFFRLKTNVKRLAQKFSTKWHHRALKDASDAAGGRIICGDMKQLNAVKAELAKAGSFQFVEPPEDFTTTPHLGADGQPDGYRSIHYAVKTKEGRQIELQLRTERQHWWAEMSHPFMEAIQGREGAKWTTEQVAPVVAYLKELSNYYWYLDNGVQAQEPERTPEVAALMTEAFAFEPKAEAAAKSLGLIRPGGAWVRRGA